MRTYSTAQVARFAGVSKVTLKRWLRAGKLAEPKRSAAGRTTWRIWTAADLARVRAFKAKHYWKGGGRKSRQPRRTRKGPR